MPLIPVEDGEIYYEEHGAGAPLMMVAGLGGVGAYWTPNLAAFAAQFRVILHDQRGTGRSSRVPVQSIAQMSRDAIHLMDHLGLHRAHWLGHSTGAAIGVDLALDHPGRIGRIVINSSTTHGDVYRRKLFGIRRTLHATAGAAAYASFTSLLLYPPWYINQNADALAEEEAKAAAGIADPAIQASRLDAILAWDRRAELPRLTVPTLVICAEDDILTPIAFSEDFARLIPGARLHRLKTGGHACSRTVPDDFEPVVLDFLRG
jgi:aminoacrylate hydrolase